VIRGRAKNMIVTGGGKNVYPEDVERAFVGLPVKEVCVVAAHALTRGGARDERLLLVVYPGQEVPAIDTLRDAARIKNRALPEYQRVRGLIVAREEFPRTASLKVKRDALVEQLRTWVDLTRDVVGLRDAR
jgi:long-chain acyl-CoA synthetase